MKVYITFKDDIFEDKYEGWHYTEFDTVWSTLDLAQKRIKVMKDDFIEGYIHHSCNVCDDEDNCQGLVGCIFDGIDDADPNKIIINECHNKTTVFYIKERRLDTLLGEGEG